MKPKNKPLKCNITRDGVLRIEIGVETLAHAAIRSDFVTNPCRSPYGEGFQVTHARAFAHDVRAELTDEDEDGSSILTRALDAALEQAIENGSEHFGEKEQ